METTKPKCGLCRETFDTEKERIQHEGKTHSAEVRPRPEREQAPAADEEETAA